MGCFDPRRWADPTREDWKSEAKPIVSESTVRSRIGILMVPPSNSMTQISFTCFLMPRHFRLKRPDD